MEYKFYQRKKEDISKLESKWINENIDSISKNENILFVYQIETEVLLITDKSIYFPNRKTKRKINFNEINKVKIGGDLLVELTTSASQVYTIVMATPIDKVKIFQVLELLIKNYRKNINSTFETIHKIFSEFKVLKYPPKQSQHKLPQVYLKQFGYLKDDQWMVSIIEKGEDFTRQKSIGSFTAETNVFDIDSEDDRIPRMFESLNADLENLYPLILDEISKNSTIPDKCWEIIVQLAPNLLVRSDYWRDYVEGILNSKNKNTFLEIIMSVHTKSFKELQELKKKHFYKKISEGDVTASNLNQILLHFLNYIFHHLKAFDLIIIEANTEKEFFTSDNPVNFKVNQKEGKLGFYSKNTELYLPLSKKYLAYFHCSNSDQTNPSLRKLKNRGIYKASDVLIEDEYDLLVKEEIIGAADRFIIIPGQMKYRKEK